MCLSLSEISMRIYPFKPILQIMHAWPRLCDLASELPHRSAPSPLLRCTPHATRHPLTSLHRSHYPSSPLFLSHSIIETFSSHLILHSYLVQSFYLIPNHLHHLNPNVHPSPPPARRFLGRNRRPARPLAQTSRLRPAAEVYGA